MSKFRYTAGLAAAALMLVGTLSAQDPRGTVSGRVTDSTGAVVPGAEVRIVNDNTGVSASAKTNDSGNFVLPYLPAGPYALNCQLQGFKKWERKGIQVRIQDNVEVNIALEVGAATETIQVTETTPLLATTDASLGQIIDERRVLELPQFAGNAMDLVHLAPGTVNGTNLRLRKAGFNSAPSQFSTDGGGNNQNEFSIDGVSNTFSDGTAPRVAFSPPQTAISEFKVQTAAFDAALGHTMGSTVNVSTKSGTNTLHGEAHEWFRHSALDAPTVFQNRSGQKISIYQDNRYGASAGAPIYIPKLYNGKNKSFWFFAYEANKFGNPDSGGNITSTVPTAKMHDGDLSEYLALGAPYQVYDPRSTVLTNGRYVRTPFTGNIIPKSRLDPVGVNMINLYPLPNQPGTRDFRNNFYRTGKALEDYWVWITRIDHAFSENHRVFLRVHYDFWKEDKNHDFLNDINGINQFRPNRGAALDDVIVLNPTTVLNLRYGFTSTKWWQYRTSRGTDLAALGFSPALVNLTDKSQAPLPRISPGAYSQLSTWEDPGDGVNSSLTHSFTANVTKLRGNHSIRFGPEFRVYRSFNNRRPVGVSPDLSFNTNFTRGPLDNSPAAPIGQDLASMLLGVPAGSMEVAASSALQNKYLGLYIHDDWKVSKRLTLNLGLRYELETPINERYNRLQSEFDGSTPNPIDAAARVNYARNPIPEIPAAQFRALGGPTWVNGSNRSPFLGEKNNLMPRIGFALQLAKDSILRGGYGIFFNTLGVNTILPLQTGFAQSTPIQASLDNGLSFVATTANPFPSGLLQPRGTGGGLETNLGQSLTTYFRPNLQGYAQRWSLGLQHVLPGQLLLDAGYVANRGTRLDVERQINATPNEYLSRSASRDQARVDYLSQQFPNPFRGTNPIYGANISRANLLRPYPQFGDLSVELPIGYSWYHSLQVRAERRFLQGFTFQLAYTWSKTMEALEFMNSADPLPYESVSSFDRTQRIASTGIWEIPVGKGRKFGSALPAPVNFLLGGWQLGAVVALQSGGPMGFGNAIFNGDINNINLPAGQRDVDRWFNTDAGFNRNANQQLASNFRQFPLRLNGVRSPGQRSWDFSIVKNFTIRESLKTQFRADAYNAWNHTNFNAPNTAPTNTAFGRITGTAGDSRNWQLSLKVMF